MKHMKNIKLKFLILGALLSSKSALLSMADVEHDMQIDATSIEYSDPDVKALLSMHDVEQDDSLMATMPTEDTDSLIDPKLQKFLKAKDLNTFSEAEKTEVAENLRSELKAFFFQEFLHRYDSFNYGGYTDYCEKLALAAVYSDSPFHKPSLNLRLAFRQDREMARELLSEIIENNGKASWISIAARFELTMLATELNHKDEYTDSSKLAAAKSIITLSKQDINKKTKIDASRLLVRCWLYKNQYLHGTISDINDAIVGLLDDLAQLNSYKYMLHLAKYGYGPVNKYITEYIEKEIAAMESLKQLGYGLVPTQKSPNRPEARPKKIVEEFANEQKYIFASEMVPQEITRQPKKQLKRAGKRKKGWKS